VIRIYTKQEQGQAWLKKNRNSRPVFACILGFTETALIPGISAAGATPQSRKLTAIADAELLSQGIVDRYHYPLPPLTAGISPVFISRAVLESLEIPIYLFNAGLPLPPAVVHYDLGGTPARCLSSGEALPLTMVQHLWEQGLLWGERLAQSGRVVILSECVVGGTTTALAVLTALGIAARHRVNSSHPQCNHGQKWDIVRQGLGINATTTLSCALDPYDAIAKVGDPMQIVVAGMAIAASGQGGVLLAGGTQMLAVYALIQALTSKYHLNTDFSQIAVGTTRWVAEDPTGDTVGLAEAIGGVSLLATQLSFAQSRYPLLQAYERGYVKEGVGAGGCAIAASLCYQWSQMQLLSAIESLLARWDARGQI
jgi:uncharacterized protein (TIGR00303 family)